MTRALATAVFEQVPIIVMDAGGTIVAINGAGEGLLRGAGSSAIVGRPVSDVFHPDCHDALREQIADCMLGPGSVPALSAVMIALDSTHVPVEVRTTSYLIDGQIQILAACHDLSDRNDLERRWREEQNFSDAALNGLPGIFYHFSEDGRFLRWNKNFEQVTGYSDDELVGMTALDFFAEDEKALIARRIAEVYRKGKAEVEARLVVKDGRRIPHLFTANLFKKDGHRGFIGVALDISDRKAIEQRLQEEHDFSSAVLDSLPGIFYHYDEGQRLIRWNKNHEVVTGYSAEELAGMSPLGFFAREDLALIASRIGDVVERGAKQSSVEANFIAKDGGSTPFLFTGVNLNHAGRRGFVGIGILCLALLALFAFIVIRALSRAYATEDLFARFAASGLAILFGVQAAINMAVNLHLIPAKGMTLPFISYGGSSMVSLAFGVGMLLALTRQRPRTEQESLGEASIANRHAGVAGGVA